MQTSLNFLLLYQGPNSEPKQNIFVLKYIQNTPNLYKTNIIIISKKIIIEYIASMAVVCQHF